MADNPKSSNKGKKRNYSTAILERKKSRNRLVVDEAVNDDNAVVATHPDDDDDMLIEILIRLPIRQAHHCMTVSKRWLSLISSPYFRHCYRIHHDHKNNFSLVLNILFTRDGKRGTFKQRVLTGTSYLSAYAYAYAYEFDNTKLPKFSMERLLFVSSDLLLINASSNDNLLVVYNGLTKQSLRLPPSPTPYYEDDINYGCLRSKDDPMQYKVVLVKPRLHLSEGILDMFVFSSSSGGWSKFSITVPSNFFIIKTSWEKRSQQATICNGMLFWSNCMIIGYDPFNKPNQCDFIDFPDKICSSLIESICITNVQGCIRLYSMNMTSTSTLSVWDLKDYNKRIWIIKHYVDLGDVDWPTINTNPPKINIKGFNPFDGDVVYLSLSDSFVAVNLTSKTLQIIAYFNFKSPSGHVLASRIFLYVPPSWPTLLEVVSNQYDC